MVSKRTLRKTPRRNSADPRIAGALFDFCEHLALRGIDPATVLLDELRAFAAARGLDLTEADLRSWWMDGRQRYQFRRREAGLCIICGKQAVTANHCERHRVKTVRRRKKLRRAAR